MAHSSQESLEVRMVDIVVVPVVDCFESFLGCVIIGIFKVSLQKVCFDVQTNFLKKQLAKGSFDPHGQIFLPW
jgi:hypothetical protein